MSDFTAAVIGAGSDPATQDRDGFAMGHIHGQAYRSEPRVELVACADIDPENGARFADRFDLRESQVYGSHETMLAEEQPDIVSICVPPALHAELTIDCCRAGVSAVHCEKPMATTWKDCGRMVKEAEETGTQLTINHQRRFADAVIKANELLDDGAIGELQRVEFGAENLYDYGTHSFDLCGYFVGEADPEWIMAQAHYDEENIWFGEHNTNQSVVVWEYETGATGLAVTGNRVAGDAIGCHHRLLGERGRIELGCGYPDRYDGVPLRLVRADSSAEEFDLENLVYDERHFDRAITAIVDGLENDDRPAHHAANALRSTQLIFGAWESVRSRGRIEFPLSIGDNPLRSMIENGVFDPTASSNLEQ